MGHRPARSDGSAPSELRVNLFRVTGASGEMADAHGSGPCVRKDVGVQLPPCPLWLRQTSRAPQASAAAGPLSYPEMTRRRTARRRRTTRRSTTRGGPMRAAGVRQFNGAVELLALPEPCPPRPDEVLMDVFAAGVGNGTTSPAATAGIWACRLRWRSGCRPPGW